MRYGKLILAILVIASLSYSIPMGEYAQADDQSTRENIRSQLKHIARYMDDVKNRMRCHSGAVAGNILKGNHGWGCYESLSRAVKGAFEECEKSGGGCEELFTIGVHNDTPETINIYLYHPWEGDFSEENALFNWTWPPGHGLNLGLDGCLLFASKRFYLKAKHVDGGKVWSERRIDNFSFIQKNYRDGQNLLIRLTID